MVWRESLCTGVQAIDAQHRQLFAQVGALIDEVRASGTLQKERCLAAVALLKEYALTHFADEEAHMKAIGYPDLVAHKQLHALFVHMVDDHEKKMEQSGFAGQEVREFAGMMVAWLNYHIPQADQRFAGFGQRQAGLQRMKTSS